MYVCYGTRGRDERLTNVSLNEIRGKSSTSPSRLSMAIGFTIAVALTSGVHGPLLHAQEVVWTDDFEDSDISDWNITNPQPNEPGVGSIIIELAPDPVDSGNTCLRMSGLAGLSIGGMITGPNVPVDLSQPYALTFDIYWTGFHWFRLSRFEHIAPVLDYPSLPMQMWTNQGTTNRHVFVGPPVDSYLPSGTWRTLRFEAIPTAGICHVYVNGVWKFTHDFGMFYSPINGVRLSDPGKPDTSDWFQGYVDNFEIETFILDCDTNSIPDVCELDCGAEDPLTLQPCSIAYPTQCGLAEDCNSNSIIDVCEPWADCNSNGSLDACDIALGTSIDCNGGGVPDECEVYLDCNSNGFLDSCDIEGGISPDCNYNGIPDECENDDDCNANGIMDICDIGDGTSSDCNLNDIPDECEGEDDCNGNSVPDICDLAGGISKDCNINGIPDECDIASELSPDCQSNGIPDECDGREVLEYRLIFMGGLGGQARGYARDVNELGQAVGRARNAEGQWRAFFWEEGNEMIDLGTLDGFSQSEAWAVNDSGQVVGISYEVSYSPRAFIGAPGEELLDLDDLGGYAIPYDINNLGQVVGVSNGQAFLWNPGSGMEPLGTPPGDWWAEALAINDAGQIVGRSGTYFDTAHAFFWDPIAGFVDIGAQPPDLPGSQALAVNQFGHVVGYSYSYSSDIEHAFFWLGEEQMYDLHSWGDESIARDINNYDEVVGEVDSWGFLWKGGNMVSTYDLLDYTIGGGAMWVAWGINDAGQIVGEGWYGDDISVPVMLSPSITADCNTNGMPDECEVFDDCNENSIPDECEPYFDCNSNGMADFCDIALGTSNDANGNDIPDECETDCNGNGVLDELDVAGATSDDCNGNGIPDECDVDFGTSADCNENLVPDECEDDCNGNGIPDDCDIMAGDGYNLIHLPPLVAGGITHAYDVNNALQIVGTSDIGSSRLHAVLWEEYSVQDLGQLDVDHDSVHAYSINSTGVVVGQSGWTTPVYAFIWDGVGSMVEIPGFGGTKTVAFDVNSQNKVVGKSTYSGFNDVYHALLWEGSAPSTDLGTLGGSQGQANAINDSDQIVGWARNSSEVQRPALWEGGAPTDLGTLGGDTGEATAINAAGTIVGWAEDEYGHEHAFLRLQGVMTDLGVLPNQSQSWANDLNASNEVVGRSDYTGKACRWRNGLIANLNDLIPPGSGWVLDDARAINDSGWIVGRGRLNGVPQAFLLVPGSADCNSNGFPDECDLAENRSFDCRGAGIPDECVETQADYDLDEDVDLDDFEAFYDCSKGPNTVPDPSPSECTAACHSAFDFDADGDVDLKDFAEFQTRFAR